jgi:hypothetical protein
MKLFIAAFAAGSLVLVAAGQPGGNKDEAKGTITLGEKTYKLSHVLAYETTRSNKKLTVVVVSEKAIDTAKLKQSFAKTGSDEDFFLFDAHVKFRFDDKGAMTQSGVYAEGANIIDSGDDNIKSAVAIKDGRAKGKVGMAKPGTFFKKSYQFDVSFDAAIIQSPRGVPEPKPAPKTTLEPKVKPKTKTAPTPPLQPPVIQPPLIAEKDLRFEGQLTNDSPKVKNTPAKIHQVKMSPGRTYLIDMESTAFDAYLRVLDSGGKELAYNDDGGDNRNARLRFVPKKDDNYQVVATRWGSIGQGAYVIKIRVFQGVEIKRP